MKSTVKAPLFLVIGLVVTGTQWVGRYACNLCFLYIIVVSSDISQWLLCGGKYNFSALIVGFTRCNYFLCASPWGFRCFSDVILQKFRFQIFLCRLSLHFCSFYSNQPLCTKNSFTFWLCVFLHFGGLCIIWNITTI